MHDESNPFPDDPQMVEQGVLSMLVADESHRPWSDEEVAREVGNPIAAADALANLYGAGLVHRLSGFVFATRPAVRAGQLQE